MAVFLVRHAHAGDRTAWTSDDRLRPLSTKGRRQAQALAGRFAAEAVTALLSSPSVRCLQTIEPVGLALGLTIDSDPRLAEGATTEETYWFLDALADGTIACSHGDVIPCYLQYLMDRGASVKGRGCEKGSVWRIDRAGGTRGTVHATYEGRP